MRPNGFLHPRQQTRQSPARKPRGRKEISDGDSEVLRQRAGASGNAQGAHRPEAQPAADRASPREDDRGRQQHLPAEERRRLPRHADGFRRQRHERPAAGGDAGGRRFLCRQRHLHPARRQAARHLRHALFPADPSGPRLRAHPGQGVRLARQGGADELSLHHHQGAHHADGRRGGRTGDRRRPRSGQRQSVQGQHGHRQAEGGDRQARRRQDRLRADGKRHQSDRRPAVLAAQPRRRQQCLQGKRRAAGARRQPAGRQSVFQQDPRGSLQDAVDPRDHPPHRRPLRHHLFLRAKTRLRAGRRHLHSRSRPATRRCGRWCRSTKAS